MNKLIKYTGAIAACVMFAQCSDYLNVTSPSNTDDEFVTSTTSETFKTLSWAYANYRQNCVFGQYGWNDPISSDVEYYPEEGSSNNNNAKLYAEKMVVDVAKGGFNGLYSVIARTSQIASIIAAKSEYTAARNAGTANDWTQLYGEAVTLKALCYYDLVRHFGDVPYGYENTYVSSYTLTSRFTICDDILAMLDEAAPLMYKLGENGITGERLSSTFAYALAGKTAMLAGGYQTIRTDVPGLYGDITFTKVSEEANGCVYALPSTSQAYYQKAEVYLQKAIDNAGTAQLVTTDDRSYANNPFQRHFQYAHDLTISPETVFEIGTIQGVTTSGSVTNEYGYAFGRPSAGGSSNAAPPKVFACNRITPMFYYGGFDNADKRRDVTAVPTGSDGKGNEAILSFTPGSKNLGGLASNKWDVNRMNPPYTTSQRQSGIDYPVLRYAEVLLLMAETKAVLGKDAEALALINQIRTRAYGDSNHNLSGLTGDAVKDAVIKEAALEFAGEGSYRWFLIRSGKYVSAGVNAQNEMKQMISGLVTNGYYTFANGNTISNYIWTKQVKLDNPLTFDCTDETNPALFPGWRGQYDYSTTPVAGKVKGTDHNTAIKGLFTYIDPNGPEAAELEADGYTKTEWGDLLVAKEATYLDNLMGGVSKATDTPRYFWPIPYETINQSKGNITNGYGLPQQ
jgi:hypothetical protein